VKIISDSFFTIGRTHQVCEDYCISGDNPNPYVILADGCSSSKSADVGARLLAHAAKDILERNGNQFLTKDESVFENLGLYSFCMADGAGRSLGMNNGYLDSTLIIMVSSEIETRVIVFGDGVIIYKYADEDNIRISSIQYCNEMPYYLSYELDNKREKLYREKTVLTQEDSHVQFISSYSPIDSDQFGKFPFYHRQKYIFEHSNFDWMMIASDGLDSFRKTATGEAIPLQEIVKRFTNFKVTNGEFVKRTVRRALKDLAKENIYPMDDVSLGCLLVKRD
jgi:hypothetical protein